MSKRSLTEFEKMDNMKNWIMNSKTLNLSLINKNLIRSNKSNSDKNTINLSSQPDKKFKKQGSYLNNEQNNNKIIIEVKDSEVDTPAYFQSDFDEIKLADVKLEEKQPDTEKTNNIPQDSDLHRSRAQRHWSIVFNVIRALKNLRNINVNNVNSIGDVDKAIDKWQNDLGNKKPENNTSKAITYDDSFQIIGDQILLFDYIATGHEENNENILKLLKKERRIRLNKDLGHQDEEQENLNDDKNFVIIYLVNHMNIDGFTPLYFACLNGHTKMVDLLVKNGADHLLKCGDKTKGEDDSVLNLSVRWSHVGVVEYLLSNLEWPIAYLKEAHLCAKGIKSKVLINMLEISIRKSKEMTIREYKILEE